MVVTGEIAGIPLCAIKATIPSSNIEAVINLAELSDKVAAMDIASDKAGLGERDLVMHEVFDVIDGVDFHQAYLIHPTLQSGVQQYIESCKGDKNILMLIAFGESISKPYSESNKLMLCVVYKRVSFQVAPKPDIGVRYSVVTNNSPYFDALRDDITEGVIVYSNN